MEQLCCACLRTGRKLYFIVQTGFYDLYSQILNEIHVYSMSQLCVRVCWECRASLQRWQRFKDRAKRSYALLMHIHNNNPELIAQPSNLKIEHVTNISYPAVKIKTEVPSDQLSMNSIVVEDEFNTETNGLYHVDVEVKIETEHCEPETFVNDLHVEYDDVKEPKIPKEKNKKKLKEKSVNKKIKTKKKKKLKDDSKKNRTEESLQPHSDGVSDREDFNNDNNVLEVSAHLLEESRDIPEEKIEEFKCKVCDVVYNLESDLKSHTDTVHKETDRIKQESRDRVKSKQEKPPSKEAGRDERPQCVECGKIFSSRKTYRYHLNVLHKGQNRYPCPRCGKVYQWKSNLGRHMRSHKARDSGELYCAACDKRFASVATYRQHLRVSRRHVAEAEFSFVCDDCGKKFVNKTRLRDHIDWDHLNKVKFRCQLCNKNAAKLKYHIVAMHTSETPYECPQCGAAFGWYSSLYRHLREVHYKMKAQPKKSKRVKRGGELVQPAAAPAH
ncbi:zinc finger protein 41-like isoform X2 [Galleria mellonella]|uniref:Zinc finger protein 41-like isoform X2 n=1 Tax=Galleria mellonella TaxID=7137 RepID=A0ABM3MAA9_GALME|nr:zinc finger protein 41-like isoform X2 [Galleria mellonella]